VPKWCKTLIAVLLLPLCLGTAKALALVVRASGRADTVWAALGAGAACWIVVYVLLPRPMWIYVAGHELTHALWTWLFGGRVKRFRATARGGQIEVTKSNFLITLAPYFFPVYAAAVVLVFASGHLIWGWAPYRLWFHFLLGYAYAFHVGLTWHVLKTSQSDITQHGYLFSAVVIWLGNVGLLLVGLPALTAQVTVTTALRWCLSETGAILQRLAQWF
jgi:hypothetical protein